MSHCCIRRAIRSSAAVRRDYTAIGWQCKRWRGWFRRRRQAYDVSCQTKAAINAQTTLRYVATSQGMPRYGPVDWPGRDHDSDLPAYIRGWVGAHGEEGRRDRQRRLKKPRGDGFVHESGTRPKEEKKKKRKEKEKRTWSKDEKGKRGCWSDATRTGLLDQDSEAFIASFFSFFFFSFFWRPAATARTCLAAMRTHLGSDCGKDGGSPVLQGPWAAVALAALPSPYPRLSPGRQP